MLPSPLPHRVRGRVVRGLAACAVAAAAAGAALAGQAASSGAALGLFQGHGDIGAPALAGGTAFNGASQDYTLSAGGVNMWAKRDEFQFAWRKMTGNFILHATVAFHGAGADPHRKAGWIIRRTLDADAPYVDVAVHGDGLTSLQYRATPGAITEQIESTVTGADIIQLERRDGAYVMSVARAGDTFTTTELTDVDLGDDVYVGLFLCSHNADTVERATFSNVRIPRPAAADFRPYRDCVGSRLDIPGLYRRPRRRVRHLPHPRRRQRP